MAKPKLGELWEYQRVGGYMPHDTHHVYHDVKKGARALVVLSNGCEVHFQTFHPVATIPWGYPGCMEQWKKVKVDEAR